MSDCPTPDKSRYATREGAESAAQRVQIPLGKLLNPYECDDCGWWHLTSRATKPVGPPTSAEEIAVLDEARFEELVIREIRGQAYREEREALRQPALVRRWEAALKLFQIDMEGQFARRVGDLTPAAMDWRRRAAFLRTNAALRRAEARSIITAMERERAGPPSPPGLPGEGSRAVLAAKRDEHLDAVVDNDASTPSSQRDLRRRAGEAAIQRLIEAHYREFAAYLIEECGVLGAKVPERVLRYERAALGESA